MAFISWFVEPGAGTTHSNGHSNSERVFFVRSITHTFTTVSTCLGGTISNHAWDGDSEMRWQTSQRIHHFHFESMYEFMDVCVCLSVLYAMCGEHQRRVVREWERRDQLMQYDGDFWSVWPVKKIGKIVWCTHAMSNTTTFIHLPAIIQIVHSNDAHVRPIQFGHYLCVCSAGNHPQNAFIGCNSTTCPCGAVLADGMHSLNS